MGGGYLPTLPNVFFSRNPNHTIIFLALHDIHETENVTKVVGHKPTNSKTCTKFQDDHYLLIGDIHQIPLILTHVQTNKNPKKSSDPLNLPMTLKFSNKGSSMTSKNSGLADRT